MEERINVAVDKEKKLKANFVLKSQGETLSTAVRKMVDDLVKEYDEMNSK